jgi:tetratricopeptide (TPR) repeat protein
MRISLCAALIVLCIGASAARAGDDKVAAKEAFREGTRQYELGDFRKALDAFKRAYLSYEEPAFLFNIAQCYRQVGDKQEALRFYKLFLRKVPDAPNRDEVQNVVTNLQSAIEQERTARSQPPSGTIGPETTTRPRPEAPIAVAPTATPTDGNGTVGVERRAEPTSRAPVYKKWWLWSAVGVVVVGAALGIGLGVGLANPQPSSHFGGIAVF